MAVDLEQELKSARGPERVPVAEGRRDIQKGSKIQGQADYQGNGVRVDQNGGNKIVSRAPREESCLIEPYTERSRIA